MSFGHGGVRISCRWLGLTVLVDIMTRYDILKYSEMIAVVAITASDISRI